MLLDESKDRKQQGDQRLADVPSQNEPLLSCKIQSSRYRKALVFHSHMLEINEDPEQLQCRYEMRDMLVAVV